MTLASVPVFRKDVRVLLKPLLWCVVLQWLYIVGVAVIYLVNGWPDLMVAASEVAVATQWMFGGLYGLVAAAHFLAEERTAGTDVFLRRLPVSRARINAEKIAAELTAVAFLWVCFAASHLLALPLGGLWRKEISAEMTGLPLAGPVAIGGILALVYVSSYLVGLLVSLAARQTTVIVLVGFAIWWTGFGFLMLALDDQLGMSWDMVWLILLPYAPLVAAPLFMASSGWRFRISRAASWPLSGRTRMVGHVWKSIAENSLLQMLSVGFLVSALVAPSVVFDPMLVGVGGLLLVAALGTAAYAPLEKQGLHCVLYQHPVPRSHLFWAKTIAAIVPVLAVSAGAFLHWSRQAPMPFLTVLALAAFAYACAVLLTLTFHRQVTALLATLATVFLTVVWPILLAESWAPATGVHFHWTLPSAEEGFVLFMGASLPLALLAVGCHMASWRMATDRAVLTGSARYRLTYFSGLYSLVVGVSALLTVAVWGDLLSFLTRG